MLTPGTTLFNEVQLAEKTTQSLWSGRGAVPWPGSTFQIIEKHTNRAITLVGDQIMMEHTDHVDAAQTHWYCVEANNYFGFHHTGSGRYIGHDGGGHLHAREKHFKSWEFFTLREFPEGGYQMLSPFWEHTLRIVGVAENGKNICRRDYSTTLWEFIWVR